MDASNYKPGDRIRLVCMHDPYSEPKKDVLGTVMGTCPRPINILNVNWDDGFGLNPCLDVDVVQKVGNIASGREFYTVETVDGKKMIRYQGFTWAKPCARPGATHACTTISGCDIEAGEDNYERMTELAESCQQYQEDMSVAEFYSMNLGFFYGTSCGTGLHVDLVDESTPDGDYHFEIEGM